MNRKLWIEKEIERLDIYLKYENDIYPIIEIINSNISNDLKLVMSDIHNYYYLTQLGNYRKIFEHISIEGFLRDKIHAVNCIFYKYGLNRYDFY